MKCMYVCTYKCLYDIMTNIIHLVCLLPLIQETDTPSPVILVYKDGQRYEFDSSNQKQVIKLESWIKEERYSALQQAKGEVIIIWL